jgi:hypothetical protein
MHPSSILPPTISLLRTPTFPVSQRFPSSQVYVPPIPISAPPSRPQTKYVEHQSNDIGISAATPRGIVSAFSDDSMDEDTVKESLLLDSNQSANNDANSRPLTPDSQYYFDAIADATNTLINTSMNQDGPVRIGGKGYMIPVQPRKHIVTKDPSMPSSPQTTISQKVNYRFKSMKLFKIVYIMQPTVELWRRPASSMDNYLQATPDSTRTVPTTPQQVVQGPVTNSQATQTRYNLRSQPGLTSSNPRQIRTAVQSQGIHISNSRFGAGEEITAINVTGIQADTKSISGFVLTGTGKKIMMANDKASEGLKNAVNTTTAWKQEGNNFSGNGNYRK